MSRPRPSPALEGVRLRLREAQIQVARCLLAVRRSDRVAAERYAVNAQIALAVIDADTSRRDRE